MPSYKSIHPASNSCRSCSGGGGKLIVALWPRKLEREATFSDVSVENDLSVEIELEAGCELVLLPEAAGLGFGGNRIFWECALLGRFAVVEVVD